MNKINEDLEQQINHFKTRLKITKVIKINIRSVLSLITKLAVNPREFLIDIQRFIYQLNAHSYINKDTALLSGDEMINFLITEKKSLIRFGDGEIYHYFKYNAKAFKKSITYQSLDNNLTMDLNKIVSELNSNSKYVLAIHIAALKMNNLENLRTGLYSLHYLQRYFYKKVLLPKKNDYLLDLLIFRPESKVNNTDLRKLWNGKDVVFINSEINNFNKFRDLHETGETIFHKIPATNAYDSIDVIMDSLIKILNNKPMVSLVAAGAAGKVIVYRLSLIDYLAYDVGHYVDWKLHNLHHENLDK
jgi:hypothetical protein